MLLERPLVLLPAFLLIGSLLGCKDGEAESSAHREEIIGGLDVRGASLDAVGALALRPQADAGVANGSAAGSLELMCTGTLIGPRTVLTAKHCVRQTVAGDADAGVPARDVLIHEALDLVFAIGPDLHAPKRIVKVESVELCNVEAGGFIGHGCDVAVCRLAESVDDVTPLAVARAAVDASAVGQKRVAIGFGLQDALGSNGSRKAGPVTVRAITGAPLRTLYPTIEAFLDAYRVEEGRTMTEQLRGSLQSTWQTPLLQGYELWAGGAPGDAQVCNGDSGGPLLARLDDKNVVVGVASSAVKGLRLPCNLGGSYATFGPKAQEIIARGVNDPCAGIPESGVCQGTVAARCTAQGEGQRRLTRVDCAAVGQRCDAAEDGAVGCVD